MTSGLSGISCRAVNKADYPGWEFTTKDLFDVIKWLGGIIEL